MAAALVAVLVLGGCSGSARPSSDANDIALRTTRLAGYPGADVGADGETAVLSLALPSALSAADVELGWQSGVAILSVAYPRACYYRIGLDAQERTVLIVTIDGKAARRAVEEDDSAALRRAARFEVPGDGVEGMPEQSESAAGREAVLDAENCAASLALVSGPAVARADALAAEWRKAYAEAPGVPAPSGTQNAASFAAERISTALARRGKLVGEKGLETLVRVLVRGNKVSTLRAYAAAVEAATAAKPLASVLALTAEATREVAKATPSRPQHQTVTSLERVTSLDTSGGVEGTSFPSEVLARFGTKQGSGVGLVWRAKDDVQTDPPHITAPDRWLAYRVPDGCAYWLAGKGGEVALTDSSLLGWGYRTFSATLVDARDSSRVLATFPSTSD